MLKFSAFLAVLLVSVSTGAMAQGAHQGTDAEQKACSRDVVRHCRKVMDQGDFVVLACLQQHRAKLTKACAKVLADHGQ
jgi:hypothetical protein